jgi:ABC-type Fe3+-hydroxamate transport system substrate-binding protein
LKVFMQIAGNPLMTVGGRHVFTDALETCGARNAFSDLGVAAGAISRETVIAADPDAIVTLGSEARTLGMWRALPTLRAVREDRLIALDSPLLSVLSPRSLDGVALLCERLDGLRGARAATR